MSWRQRGSFDGVNVPREDENLTKYDQKYTLPTDMSNGGYNSEKAPEPPMFSGPNGTPAPDPNEQSYVFGGTQNTDNRASVFGGGAQNTDGRANVFGGGAQQPAEQQSPFAGLNNIAFNGVNTAPPASAAATPVGGGYTAPPVVQNECPMVFALRANPEMFVYEYSDRLEYYRRTHIGMVHCYTESKVKKY